MPMLLKVFKVMQSNIGRLKNCKNQIAQHMIASKRCSGPAIFQLYDEYSSALQAMMLLSLPYSQVQQLSPQSCVK